jgi:hypothetical protein
MEPIMKTTFVHISAILANVLDVSLDSEWGVSESDIVASERRLSFTIPASLRAFYSTFGNLRALTKTYENILLPSELEKDNSGILICLENQCSIGWGIRYSDCTTSDPPVCKFHKKKDRWVVEFGCVTDFLNIMCVWQVFHALPCQGILRYDDIVNSIVRDRFTAIPTKRVTPEIPKQSAFYNDYFVAYLNHQSKRLYLGGKTSIVFESFIDDNDLWLCDELE